MSSMLTSMPAASAITGGSTRRKALRTLLRRWEPLAGPDGFEGLVPQALATLTGYTFRLARSGAQFGRDAATPNAPFAIAMEAKRYNDSVPLQELVGKAALAAFELAQGVDFGARGHGRGQRADDEWNAGPAWTLPVTGSPS